MKAYYSLLTIILPLTVGAQNTNSERLQEEQATNINQLAKQQEEWQEERIKELTPKAEQGDAAAQYELGQMLLYGEAFEPPKPVEPKPEGVKWLRKAAEQGNLPAQCALAGVLRFNPGTDTEAIKWLRAAADQGAVRAQFDLGICYEQGDVVPTDYPEAAKLFRKAAEQGNEFAQARLAELYSVGKGVPRDLKEAYVWDFLAKVFGAGNVDPSMPLETETISLHPKNEEKLTGSELADAQKEAVGRLVEIAKRVNATESPE